MILSRLQYLHAIQMSWTRQNEHNAVHDAEIMDNLGEFYIKLFTGVYMSWYTCSFHTICAFK